MRWKKKLAKISLLFAIFFKCKEGCGSLPGHSGCQTRSLNVPSEWLWYYVELQALFRGYNINPIHHVGNSLKKQKPCTEE